MAVVSGSRTPRAIRKCVLFISIEGKPVKTDDDATSSHAGWSATILPAWEEKVRALLSPRDPNVQEIVTLPDQGNASLTTGWLTSRSKTTLINDGTGWHARQGGTSVRLKAYRGGSLQFQFSILLQPTALFPAAENRSRVTSRRHYTSTACPREVHEVRTTNLSNPKWPPLPVSVKRHYSLIDCRITVAVRALTYALRNKHKPVLLVRTLLRLLHFGTAAGATISPSYRYVPSKIVSVSSTRVLTLLLF